MMDYGDVMTTSDWPDNAMKYNGISWPTVCFDDAEAHFFTIGDALLKFSRVKSSENRDLSDYNAQTLVASQMKVKAQELQQKGTPPRFVLNVGDNFYPGGINAHCDSVNTPSDSFLSWQQEAQLAVTGESMSILFRRPHALLFRVLCPRFRQVFENMYKVEDLGNMEWWSARVLGNHDYGGVCYIKGWDQQIFYTFKDGGRWIMPAQYWHRRVQFKTFDADIWFLDTNVLDTQNPADNPDHNLCANRGNSDKFQYCEKNRRARAWTFGFFFLRLPGFVTLFERSRDHV
ncbi:PAP4 [Symbiodinium necroappetens]|uniref:PAP4 protein n=1 Tax=Symbiodinium necroappetens TaxID=1628268 RepID=A0A812Q2I4_9DINO|nr:PAP4 [Symbiodinium necroappetens]